MGPLTYIALAAGAGAALLAVYAFFVEPRIVRLEKLDVPVPDLPSVFDGLRIAHLTDMHVGGRAYWNRASRRAIEVANECKPDLVVLTGDLVHRDPYAHDAAELLQPLNAPLGVWTVLGNHDYNWTWTSRVRRSSVRTCSDEQWANLLRGAGVTMLANESVAIERDGRRLWLAGCGDPYCLRDDLPRTLRSVHDGEPCVLLCHSPDIVDHPLAPRAALVLCGHTHGGQVRLPLVGPIYAPCHRPRERSRGLVRVAGTLMYANRGIGASNILRFHCPPEVALITLRCSPQKKNGAST